MVVRVIPDPIHAQKQRISTLLPSSMLLMMNTDNNIKYNCKNSINITKIIDSINCDGNIFRIDDHQKNDEMITTANNHHVNGDEKDYDDHHSNIIHNCQQVKHSLETCDISSTAPVVVFISKMIPFRLAELASRDIALLNSNQASSISSQSLSSLSSSETTGNSNVTSEHEILTPNSEVFVALGRVFSGILTRNTELFVIGNKYDPFTNTITTTLVNKHHSNYDDNNANDNSHHHHHHQKHHFDKNSSNSLPEGIQKIPENSIGLYLMLGPSILSIDEVYAGNIVGIIGLNQYILKTATLSSIYHIYPIKAMTFQTKPMLKVAIETKSHLNLKKIEYGIQQLYQYDPVVEIGCDESTGQLTITCLGELHLEQCLKALIERFAKCDINVSEPLIAFRETIISSSSSSSSSSLPPPWCDMVDKHAHNGRLRFVHTSEQISFTFRCFPLKSKIINFLNKKSSSILEKLDQFLSEYHRKFDLTIYNHYDVGQTNNSKNQQSKSANTIIIPSCIKHFCTEFLSMLIDCDNNDEDNNNNDGNGDDDDNLLDISLSELRDHAMLLKQQQQHDDDDNSSSKINSNDDNNNNNNNDDAMIELVINHILAIGSQMCCTNIMLLNENSNIEISCSNSIISNNHLYSSSSINRNSIEKEQIINLNYKNHQKLFHNIYSRLHSTINASFQAATYAGPLMHEPMYGVGFYFEKIELTTFLLDSLLNKNEKHDIYNQINIIYNDNDILKNDSNSNGSNDHQLFNVNTGQLISEVKLALHSCILSISSSSLRIMEPIYQCSLQCDQNQLNNLYSVILSRRGIIYEEDVIEGTTLFLLQAYIPIYNSFGFTQQLLKKTSGKGITPQLHLSHYQKLNKNPFWKPTTNDEIEIYGDNQNNSIEKINLSRTIIDQVRKRKGLIIEEKVVMYAEKQRTLNKKK